MALKSFAIIIQSLSRMKLRYIVCGHGKTAQKYSSAALMFTSNVCVPSSVLLTLEIFFPDAHVPMKANDYFFVGCIYHNSESHTIVCDDTDGTSGAIAV